MATIVPVNPKITNKNGVSAGAGSDQNLPKNDQGRMIQLRSVSVQASVGQTDWLWVPAWAAYMKVYLNVSASAGTTPICQVQVLTSDPSLLNDATDGSGGGQLNIGSGALTGGITSNGNLVVTIGPGLTGIADVLAIPISGNGRVMINSLLPQLVGIQVLNDRTTGDETYTYKLSVEFFD